MAGYIFASLVGALSGVIVFFTAKGPGLIGLAVGWLSACLLIVARRFNWFG